MTILCPISIRGRALRITRQDVCGRPEDPSEAMSRHVSESFTLISFDPDIEAGTEILRKNARGIICVRSPGVDQLKGFRVELRVCGINQPMLEMMIGVLPAMGGGTDTIGGIWPKDMDPDRNVQLEVWTDNDDDTSCEVGSGYPYVHFILPKISRWTLGAPIQIQDDALDVVLRGYMEPNGNYAPSEAGSVDDADATVLAEQGMFMWQGTDTVPVASGCDYEAVGS